MTAKASTERWTEPRAVVIGSVEWRCVMLGEGTDGDERFGASGHSGRSTGGTLRRPESATLEERVTAGLRRARGMSWVNPDDGVGYTFHLEPGAPPRISVSGMDRGIHTVPLPPGRFLTGLGDKGLATLVQQALDRQDDAKWVSEGGAVGDRSDDEAGPEV